MTKGVYDEASDVKLFDKSHRRPSTSSNDPEYAGNKHREQRHLLRHQVGIMNVLYCLTAFITIATVIFYVVNKEIGVPSHLDQVEQQINDEVAKIAPRLEAVKARLKVIEENAEDSLNDLRTIQMLTNNSFRFDEIAAKAGEVESQKNTSLEAQQNNARLIIQGISNISSKFRRIEERSRKIEIRSNESIEEIDSIQSDIIALVANQTSRVLVVEAKISDLKKQLRRFAEGFRTFQAAYPSSCNHVDLDEVLLKSGLRVFCVSGYVLIQNNVGTGSVFNKDWESYKYGFEGQNYAKSKLPQSYWLGLETIHQLTRRKNCLLRIILYLEPLHVNKTFVTRHVQYSTFYIDGESDNYALHVSGFSGAINDGLKIQNNSPFTSRDRDNDQNRMHNCARIGGVGRGGWWYKDCGGSNLNGHVTFRKWTHRFTRGHYFLIRPRNVNTTMLLECG